MKGLYHLRILLMSSLQLNSHVVQKNLVERKRRGRTFKRRKVCFLSDLRSLFSSPSSGAFGPFDCLAAKGLSL